MKHKLFLLAIAAMLAACSGNQKKDANDSISINIHKIWEFKKIDTAKSDLKGRSTFWIGDNSIDMTNNDTLRYSTIATNNGTTVYPYKLSNDCIYLNDKQVYRVVKLTDTILELSALYQVQASPNAPKDSLKVVMVYKAR
jgi:hypothetical protein